MTKGTPHDRSAPRVAYLTHTAEMSGGEIALLRLLPAMHEIEPVVILGGPGPLQTALSRAEIEVHVLPMGADADTRKDAVTGPSAILRSGARTIRYAWRLARLLRRLDVQLVHANSLKAGFYGCTAARLARLPSVWHVRDRLAADYLPGFAVRLSRAAVRLLPTWRICNSIETRSCLTAQPTPAMPRTAVVYDAYEPARAGAADSAVAATGRTGAELTFVMVGRLAPWKGQRTFVRAFHSAFEDRDGVRAVVVGAAMFGEHDYEAELLELVDELGLSERIIFVGFTDNVAAYLQAADVAVHASEVPEPFGQVIVESLAAGVPVIAPRAGGPLEILAEGRFGLLFDPGDIESLATALETMAGDDEMRARFAGAGPTRALQFAPSHSSRGVMKVYRSMGLFG